MICLKLHIRVEFNGLSILRNRRELGTRWQCPCIADLISTLLLPSLQEDNRRMRDEIDSLRRKYDALKGFANQKKIRLPMELDNLDQLQY